MMDLKRLTLPLSDEAVRSLRAGDCVLLSGTVYTARDAAHKRIIEALTEGPRRAFRLDGGVLPGQPADLTVIDPDAAWTVDPAEFLSKGRSTPFAGKAVRSRIILTLKDGAPVWKS